MAGEELVFEVEDNDVPGLEASTVKMQVTYFDTTVSATGNNEVEAMNNVSIEMLKVEKIMKIKVGNCKNADQEIEVTTSLSLHLWCSLL